MCADHDEWQQHTVLGGRYRGWWVQKCVHDDCGFLLYHLQHSLPEDLSQKLQ